MRDAGTGRKVYERHFLSRKEIQDKRAQGFCTSGFMGCLELGFMPRAEHFAAGAVLTLAVVEEPIAVSPVWEHTELGALGCSLWPMLRGAQRHKARNWAEMG